MKLEYFLFIRFINVSLVEEKNVVPVFLGVVVVVEVVVFVVVVVVLVAVLVVVGSSAT